MAKHMTVVVSKDRGGRAPQADAGLAVVAVLADAPGIAAVVVPHLYDLTPDGSAVERLRSIPGDLVVLSWIYPRAAFWVLDAHGVRGHMGRSRLVPEEETEDAPRSRGRGEVPDRTIWCLDLRAQPEPDAYVEEIVRLAGIPLAAEVAGDKPQCGRALATEGADEPVTPRWYPVIDFSRCTNCLECLNFCLFGVFGLDESEAVVVEEPDACRHGCPACARICPSGAILFPQHDDPSIAGDGAAATDGVGLSLLQLFTPGDAQVRAAAERRRAVDEQRRHAASDAPPAHQHPRAERSDLDRLVDEVDDLEM